jgi:translation initiation factor 2 alpha subunit (eIF-2alpha)
MEYKEEDIILCTVKKIEGMTVFLEMEDGTQASMAFSEVAAGRIRNIREFIVPNKKIVCKILRIRPGHIELSLRRVTGKEREEIMEQYKKKRVLETILKPVLKEKSQQIIAEIENEYSLSDFIERVRNDPSILGKFVPKKEAEMIQSMFVEKEEKEKEIKKTAVIKTMAEDGVHRIQQVLTTNQAEVRYLGSSKFSITTKNKEVKIAHNAMEKVITEMKNRAKEFKVELEIK